MLLLNYFITLLRFKKDFQFIQFLFNKKFLTEQRCSVNKSVLKTFTKFTGKHMCRFSYYCFLLKKGSSTGAFLKFCERLFYRTSLFDCIFIKSSFIYFFLFLGNLYVESSTLSGKSTTDTNLPLNYNIPNTNSQLSSRSATPTTQTILMTVNNSYQDVTRFDSNF